MKPVLLVALLALSLLGCTPGSSDKWTQATSIAFASGPAFAEIVEHLPPEAFMGEHANLIDRRWYDSDRTLNIQSDGAGGYYLDISSASSGESVVKNNANAFQFGAQGLSALEQLGMQALMAQGGGGALAGALPGAVTRDPLADALRSFIQRTGRRPNAAELEAVYQSLETLGIPVVSSSQPAVPVGGSAAPVDPNLPSGIVPGVPGVNQ